MVTSHVSVMLRTVLQVAMVSTVYCRMIASLVEIPLWFAVQRRQWLAVRRVNTCNNYKQLLIVNCGNL